MNTHARIIADTLEDMPGVESVRVEDALTAVAEYCDGTTVRCVWDVEDRTYTARAYDRGGWSAGTHTDYNVQDTVGGVVDFF